MPNSTPKIAQMLQELQKFALATSLDLSMGYYTIKINSNAKTLCTIVTPFGKYQYLRLPTGISSSPNIFQEKMSDIMQNLNFVRTYLDDVLVISLITLEDHLEKMECVLKILSDKGLRFVTLVLASPLIATTSLVCMDLYTFTGPGSATSPGLTSLPLPVAISAKTQT
jgi:hypothetical protein